MKRCVISQLIGHCIYQCQSWLKNSYFVICIEFTVLIMFSEVLLAKRAKVVIDQPFFNAILMIMMLTK
jgi:hypothetical protein